MDTVCRRYKGYVVRKFNDHYIIVTEERNIHVDTYEEAKREIDEMEIRELAKDIIDLDWYGSRDADETIETVAEQIKNHPVDVIRWLIGWIVNESGI